MNVKPKLFHIFLVSVGDANDEAAKHTTDFDILIENVSRNVLKFGSSMCYTPYVIFYIINALHT